MAQPGTFEKAKRQIEGAIKRQKKKGGVFAAMDLPYFTQSDKALTDEYIEELKTRGFRIANDVINSSWYGRVEW